MICVAYLEEIPKYKDDLSEEIVKNENIIKYIGNTDVGTNIDAIDLIGMNIFPFPYIPSTQTETRTYICFDVYVPRVKDDYFKDVNLVLNVFSHKEHNSYKGKSRVDMIDIELDKILNGNRDYGFGEVKLVSVLPYIPNANYFGKQLSYTVENFNQRKCKHNEHKI